MKSIPRLKFAHLPTVIEPLPRLSALLDGPQIYVKRDDQTGLAFGGNKTRKLEFLLAEAQSHGARTLITAGAVQSNHCRQTAGAAARFGMRCMLVLAGEQPEIASGNVLLDDMLGAEIIRTSKENRDQTLQASFNQAWDEGKRPYLIPYGGSNATGVSAYVFAMQELHEQLMRTAEGFVATDQETSVDFDWILTASSSGGTQAGMVLGKALFDINSRILGISVDQPEGTLKGRVAELATAAADHLGESITFSPSQVEVNADYLGGGYGVMGDLEREAIDLFARREGLLLDPVYTGRAAGALVDLIRKGFFEPGQKVLFWHTGGTPALFADKYSPSLIRS
jgi:D-cysteine desulfhydrase family pyridoxal phosphate-dependent enzyme